MSVRVTARVWPVPLPAPLKLVLLRLADCARDDGTDAWRTTTRMMAETGLSERTVRNALRGLEDRGLIDVTRPADAGRKLATVYRVTVPDVADTGAAGAPVQGQEMPPSAETGAAGAPLRGQELPATGAGAAPSPSYSPSKISEEESPDGLSPIAQPAADLVGEMVSIYVEVLGNLLPQPKKITPERRKKALARLKDSCGGSLDAWREACQQVATSDFLTGRSRSGWRADFDWMLATKDGTLNLLKLSEGKYINRPGGRGGFDPETATAERAAEWVSIVNELEAKRARRLDPTNAADAVTDVFDRHRQRQGGS